MASQPLVWDNGSGVIKAGFAGTEVPNCIVPNIVGEPKHMKSAIQTVSLEGEFVGAGALQHRGLLRLRYPMECGTITDWEGMERVWSRVYDELKVRPTEHPVLFTEPPHTPCPQTERSAEFFFETMGVPGLLFSVQAVLSLFAAAKTTGAVLDVGDGVAHAVPVYEGYAIAPAIQRADIAGRAITDYLQLLLLRSGYHFHTTAEVDMVRTMKEKCCQVAPTANEALESAGLLLPYGQVAPSGSGERPKAVPFELPDGNIVELGPERFLAPEGLFDPTLLGSELRGVQKVLATSIRKSDLDLRPALAESMTIAGGSTLFPGFGERLLTELKQELPNQRLRIHSPPERKYTAWLGGSILASLSSFNSLCITAERYKEEGERALHGQSFL